MIEATEHKTGSLALLTSPWWELKQEQRREVLTTCTEIVFHDRSVARRRSLSDHWRVFSSKAGAAQDFVTMCNAGQCTYPECKCIVMISTTSRGEPERCPAGLL